MRDVPYDRPLTTMAGFAMCAPCAAEYHDPADRRFHAQPTCCPACGPRAVAGWRRGAGVTGRSGEPSLAAPPSCSRQGQVLAVKGLGGYHLAVDAASEQAAAALRARKHREDKPFAVMVADLAAARRLCEVDEAAAALLTSRAAADRAAAAAGRARTSRPSVAPGNRQLGSCSRTPRCTTCCSRRSAGPIVLTSGNVSDEPIAYRDDDALARLAGIADAFLVHDRADPHQDRRLGGAGVPRAGRSLLRRSRGYAPEPLRRRPAVRRGRCWPAAPS